MYENVHLNLAVKLLLERTEVKCGKVYFRDWSCISIALTIQSYQIFCKRLSE